MAGLADYIDLQLAVGDTVGRRDLVDQMRRFTLAAEERLSKELRCAEQQTEADLTFTGGVATIPADCVEFVHVLDSYGVPLAAAPLDIAMRSGNEAAYFATVGNTVRLRGFDGVRRALYYTGITPSIVTSLTGTNWLLQRHSDVYLYAVAAQAAAFLRDPNILAPINELFEKTLSDLKRADERFKWSAGRVAPDLVMP